MTRKIEWVLTGILVLLLLWGGRSQAQECDQALAGIDGTNQVLINLSGVIAESGNQHAQTLLTYAASQQDKARAQYGQNHCADAFRLTMDARMTVRQAYNIAEEKLIDCPRAYELLKQVSEAYLQASGNVGLVTNPTSRTLFEFGRQQLDHAQQDFDAGHCDQALPLAQSARQLLIDALHAGRRTMPPNAD